MHPWWTFNGSGPENYRFDIPFTQQNRRFKRVLNLQSLYRLALGQSNQEGLVRTLQSKKITDKRIRELEICLKPDVDGLSTK